MKGVQLACLLVGAFAAFAANSPKIYSAVKEEWKHKFAVEPTNWTGTEISNVYAISSLGFFIVPCGLIYDSFGTFGVLAYGTVLTAGGFGGIAYLFDPALNLSPWVYGLLYALTIQGGCALNFGSIWTNSKVFPASQGGMVTGVMLGVYSCGALFMVELYKRGFQGTEDVKGYMFTWTAIVAGIGLFTTTLLPMLYDRHVKAVAAEAENAGDRQRAASINALAKPRKQSATAAEIAKPAEKPPTPLSAIFADIRFWMICSIYCFCTALGMAWGGNMRSILTSYWYDNYEDKKELGVQTSSMIQFFVLTELAARLGMGIISDLVAKFISRLQVICFLTFLMTVSMLGQVFFGGVFTIPMLVLMGLSYAGLYAVIPPYLRSTFDVRRFGLITGMGYSFMIPGNMVFCNIFAYYAEAAKGKGMDVCAGDACYSTSFLIGGVGCLIPFLFTLIMSFYDTSVADANAAAKAAAGYGAAGVKDEDKAPRRRSSLSVPEYHPDLEGDEEFQRVAAPDDEQSLVEKGRAVAKAR